VLSRDIGSTYQYSNIGSGLLGDALSRKGGTNYETLVQQRIFVPLQMTSTGCILSNGVRGRLAVGHDTMLKPVENWDVPGIPGAGALHSTMNDLLNFLSVELSSRPSAIKPAMTLQLSITRPTPIPDFLAGLGWFVRPDPKGPTAWKDGTTGGYSAYMGVNPLSGTGVVVLANASPSEGMTDIGEHVLLGRALANPKPAVIHAEIVLSTIQKERFVGRYQLDQPKLAMTIALDGDQLTAEWTGQPTVTFFPETPTQIFSKSIDAQLSLDLGPGGTRKSVTLHRNGRQFVFVQTSR
jgi:serine-type D-Ala-D-Ala carboxypeptidase/endopeptidase